MTGGASPGSAAGADVLIVGAGSAGSVIAERLSRDPACSVTVLEAGAGPDDVELAAATRNGRRLPIGPGSGVIRRYPVDLIDGGPVASSLVRGRGFGGSGAINGGYFCRGLPDDFDTLGLADWSWPAVLDHFRAIETDLDFPGPLHGDRGPIAVRRDPVWSDGSRRFADAATRAGFAQVLDLNGADAAAGGFGSVPLNLAADGRRADPGSAFLLPALRRPNLTLRARLRATGIQISGGRARAVRCVGDDGTRQIVHADRIVLCAGAIESAHLLMLSGVGDPAMLRHAGVTPLVDLPVGRHCSDHPEWLTASPLPGPAPGTGPAPILDVVLHDGDIEIRPYTRSFAAMTGADDGSAPQIGVSLMRPRARGRLTLLCDDPAVSPRIECRYDSAPADVAELRRGSGLLADILGRHPGEPSWSTSQHLCGTAPVGAEGDATAVLDQRCRVRGVEGLWVVDAASLPSVPARGPHATIVMLGHLAADFVVDSPTA